jgi:RNase P/RNase MRP subunit p29
MNLIGSEVSIVAASDPTLRGRRGEVVLETAQTLMLSDGGRFFRIPKKGTSLLLTESGELVTGELIRGRLEDRLKWRGR